MFQKTERQFEWLFHTKGDKDTTTKFIVSHCIDSEIKKKNVAQRVPSEWIRSPLSKLIF